VVRALGLKGQLGISAGELAWDRLEQVMLRKPGAPEKRLRVRDARRQGKLWAVLVEGVDDRDAAEAWVGSEVWVTREQLGGAGEGQHFWADLEGLAVVTVAGVALGRVTGFYATGGVDVLVVEGEGGERLIPLAPYVTVDRDAKRIVVDPPEGLL
jgi:16S rRNA processing protein RimM